LMNLTSTSLQPLSGKISHDFSENFRLDNQLQQEQARFAV